MRNVVAGLLLVVITADACVISSWRKLWIKPLGSQSKLFAFERDGRVGFIDRRGKVVIRPTIGAPIEKVGDFSDGLARVGGQGYIDQAGRWAIERTLLWAEDYSNGLAWAYVGNVNDKDGPQAVLLDRAGKTVATRPGFDMRAFSEGLAGFVAPGRSSAGRRESRNHRDFPGLKGFLNRQGQVVIEPSFAEVGPFRGGLAVAVVDGYCHIARPHSEFRSASPTTGYASDCGGAPDDAVAPCRTGFIDRTGRFAIEARFEAAQDFQEKLAAVRLKGLWGFIDAMGTIVISPRFEQVKSFSEGLAPVKAGGKWGFVDASGQVAIPPTFSEVEPFSDSLALVYSDRGASYIDTQGKIVISGPFKEATPFVNGLAAVLLSDTQVAYIDHGGKTVFQYSRRR